MKHAPKALDEIVDKVLAYRPAAKNPIIKNKALVETWSVPLADIYKNENMRLDASHYDRQTEAILKELRNTAFPLKPLSDLASINLPGQFSRIWAQDENHGIRYINATDLMSLTGIGLFSADARFLSRESEVDIEELIIHTGWMLLTCSGTIGRVFYVAERLDGWVATHDLIRVIPHDDIPVGFLHAYLSSQLAQKQIIAHTHGGQIDHVTHHQVGGIMVPMLAREKILEIHRRTMRALNQREEAIASLTRISDDIEGIVTPNRGSKHGKR
ncbi:MAG: restriction endonuclease subunit S [Nitrospirae bacterium]|nr:restriction endonuclease subunit S [Nitrospirota bacterium]